MLTVRAGSHLELATELGGVGVDNVITDPPYSDRVSAGVTVRRRRDRSAGGVSTSGLTYDHWTEADARAFVEAWTGLCRRWFVVLCSHDQLPMYEALLRGVGRYVFAPVPCIIRGMTVRLTGDGPSSWSAYALAARPRGMRPLSGTLRGGYVGPRERLPMAGGKPLWLMRDLVTDYSRPGELVCDPCAGAGTTLLAATRLGRAVIGSEANAARAALANQRLAQACQVQA